MLDPDSLSSCIRGNPDSSYLDLFKKTVNQLEANLLSHVESNGVVTPEKVDISGLAAFLSSCGNLGQQIVNRSRKINIERVNEVNKVTESIRSLEEKIVRLTDEMKTIENQNAQQQQSLTELGRCCRELMRNTDLDTQTQRLNVLRDSSDVANAFLLYGAEPNAEIRFGEKVSRFWAGLRDQQTPSQLGKEIYVGLFRLLTNIQQAFGSTELNAYCREWEQTNKSYLVDVCSNTQLDIRSALLGYTAVELLEIPIKFLNDLDAHVHGTAVIGKDRISSKQAAVKSARSDIVHLRALLATTAENSRWERKLCTLSEYRFSDRNIADLWNLHRTLDQDNPAQFAVLLAAVFGQRDWVSDINNLNVLVNHAQDILSRNPGTGFKDLQTMINNKAK